VDRVSRWLPDRLEQQENWLRDHPETEVVFGLVQNFAQQGCEAGFDPLQHHLDQWLPGYLPSAILIRRATLERMGGFTESLKSSEMVDLFIRLRESGVILATPEIPVARRRLHGANKRLQTARPLGADLRLLRNFIARKRARQTQS